MRIFVILQSLVSFSLCSISRSNAAYHHCIDGAELSIQMRGDNDAKDILMTNIRYKNHYLASQKCSWKVLMTNMSVPQFLFMSVRMRPMHDGSVSEDGEACNSTASLNVTLKDPGNPLAIFSFEFKAVQNMSDSFRVLPITNKSHLFLATFSTGSEQPSANCKRIELVLSSVVKGYCDRYMLLHKTKCHFVSDTELRVDQWNQTGLALTGFSNIDEMRHLLKDNDRRLREHPYARPLNLSSPVRVGVFRCPKSEHAVYWKSENGKCKLETANFSSLADANSSDPSTIQCMSLSVGVNGHISVGLIDCRLPMRSLLSFPNSPRQSEDSCRQLPPCPAQMTDQTSYVTREKTTAGWGPVSRKVLVSLIFLAFCILGGVAVCPCKWRCRSSRQSLDIQEGSNSTQQHSTYNSGMGDESEAKTFGSVIDFVKMNCRKFSLE